jgi:peptidyl-prolyl cis-trans isomerase A (cyclophilin A)
MSCTTEKDTIIEMNTVYGSIYVKLFVKEAPTTCNNFLRYIDEHRYKDFHFYRTVTKSNQPMNNIKIEVIQGGLGFEKHPLELPPILHETTNATGIKHINGTISMEKIEPGSASSEIFICINDQPELNYGGRRNIDGQGFAAFGKVIKGLNVVKVIHSLPEKNQFLNKKVKVNSIKRI